MPTVGFGRISADASFDEVIDRLAKLEKTLEYLFGGLDTKNIREISGWLVNPNELVSRDRDVGMSTEDTAGDDVRFFAGAPGGDKEDAPWRVTKSGIMNAVGAILQSALIESASGYPKIVIDPEENLLKIMTSADKYIEFVPFSNTTSTPVINVVDLDLNLAAVMHLTSTGFSILGAGVTDINMNSAAGSVKFSSWSNVKNAGTNKTLQAELNDIWTAIVNNQDDIDDLWTAIGALEARVSALENSGA